MNVMNIAQEVFHIEAKEIENLVQNLTPDFEKAVNDILVSSGKLIVSGMGKSGIIGKKIAATLASTGTPSFYLHPGEAYHGDLGMIEPSDTLLLISNSGETDEVLRLIPFLKSQNNTIVAMSGNPNSTLAQHSTYHLNINVSKEACPLQLAPTSSTTATLVMGDALAIALMRMRSFKDSDFAQFHPGGSLGRRLLTRVEDVMRKEKLPTCTPQEAIKEVVHIVSEGKMGLAIVMDEGRVDGVITDGDIRRAMEEKEEQFFGLKAFELMSKNPKSIGTKTKLLEVQKKMAEYKVNSLLVTDESKLVGVVQIYDLGI